MLRQFFPFKLFFTFALNFRPIPHKEMEMCLGIGAGRADSDTDFPCSSSQPRFHAEFGSPYAKIQDAQLSW